MKKLTIIFTLILALLSSNVLAKLTVDTLLDTKTSWDGGDFSYGQGSAKIIIQKITADTYKDFKSFHCHTTPLAAYVVKGKVEVVKKSGESRIFKAGDALVEVMNQWHAGKFNKDTELIVFYANSDQHPLNVYANDPQAYLCQ